MAARMSAIGSRVGGGCFILFALPFAAVGVWMGYWLCSEMFAHWQMRSWEETPARIVWTKLESDSDSEGGVSYRATAEYTYRFQGQQYTGHRVSVHSGSDNIGSFQLDAHRQLTKRRKSHRPFHCYVNPEDPSEAVLFRDLRWEMVAFRAVFASVFGAAGFGMLAFAVLGYRKAKVDAALAALHPDEPWLCKKAWADGKIKSSSGAMAIFLVVFAFFWNVMSVPATFAFFYGGDKHGGWVYLLLAFPAIGVILLLSAIVAVSRWLKFGHSILEMASVPGVVGGQLAGVIHIPLKIEPEDGFRLILSCIQKTVCGEDSKETTLWQDEQLIEYELAQADPERSTIPVLFQIPYDCRPTDETSSRERTFWRLVASAKVPGPNLSVNFEVPVFKTPASDPNFVVDRSLIAEYAAPEDPERDLRDAGLVKMELPSGEGFRLVFPMARAPGMAFLFMVVGLVFGGVPIIMYYASAPWFISLIFSVVFGALGLLLLAGSVDVWFYRSVVNVSTSGLTVRGGWLVLGRERRIDLADVEKIDLKSRMSMSNPTGVKVYYDIDVVCRTGKKVTAGKRVPGKRLADSVVRQIEQAMGKK
jgi:hypothetical protein